MEINKTNYNIMWEPPKIRRGFYGAIDRLCGPGASKAELYLQFAVAIGIAIVAGFYHTLTSIDWSLLQIAIAVALAFDIAGGIATNATSSAKRWFHRPEQSHADHLKFVATHLIHLALVASFFLTGKLTWFMQSSLLLAVAACIVIYAPLYVKRPLAYSVYMIVFLLSEFWIETPAGLEWFLPLFYFKLLVSHLPPEAPFGDSK